MAGNNRIGFQVGFSVDKSGLSEMQSLFQQIANKAKEPGNELKQGLQKAATTANTLDQILEKTFNTNLGTLNVTKFNQELSKSGLTLKQVKSDLSAVGNQGATAYNRLAQAVLGTNLQLKQSSKLLDEMAISMKNTVKWGITSSIFNNITNALSKAVTYSKQLDTSLNDIRIVTDKSAESMDRFAEKANAAAKQMGASTLDYTNAALIYYQQGLSDEETAARAETTIKAANVTGQTGQEVSEQLTAVWNGYKVTAEETELYVDKLAAVAATTAADLEELSTGMSKVASAANAMGVDFDDLNAQIATIVSVTRQAPESVGTALKTIYARLGDLKVDGVDEFGVKLGEVSAQLQQMGIQILDQEGNLRDMTGVIAEVAEKWNGWTEAQRQAAAVAMAGKRQYNNLIALFDNWDMYTDALETSTEAMGTLQHQQDIYMESTAAKLKTLKATWQDLYGGLIDENELNTGIEGLTNLVQVFDNFIDSFGGGLKSIGAFGAIVANIFNKQIANAINNAYQNYQKYQQNIDMLQSKVSVMQQGGAYATNFSSVDQSVIAGLEKQIELARKIYDARAGLNSEEYNILTNYQQEIGALESQITKEEILAEKESSRLLLSKTLTQDTINSLKTGESALDILDVKYADIEDKVKDINQVLNNQSAILTKELGANKLNAEGILKVAKSITESIEDDEFILSSLTEKEKEILDVLSNQVLFEDQVEENKQALEFIIKRILNLTKEEKQQVEEEFKAAERLEKEYRNIEELKAQQKGIQYNFDEGIKQSFNSASIIQGVTTVTSALGSMAMAWSSVNSLIQTWNDESTSFNDKIAQTFMTLGMSLPIVISSFTKLNEVFGVSNSLSILFSANKAKEVALSGVRITQQEIENRMLQKYAKIKGITVAEISNSWKAKIAESAASQAEAIATDQAASATWRLNAALTANPIGAVILLLTALTAILAKVIAYQKEQLENQIKSNNVTIERVNKIQEEAKANQELCDSYDELYNKYKNNEVGKDALYEVTDKLCEKYNLEGSYLAKLTGNYDDLTEAIKQARLEELEYVKEQTKNKFNAAKDNLIPNARQGKGYLLNEDYTLSLGSGGSGFEFAGGTGLVAGDEQEIFKNLLNVSGATVGSHDIFGNIAGLGFQVNAKDPEQIVKLYDELTEQVNLMRENLDPLLIQDSEAFNTIVNWLEKMQDPIEQYRNALDELNNYTTQEILLQSNLGQAANLDDYTNAITNVREQLLELFDGDIDKVNSLIETYVSSLDNEFLKTEQGIDSLGQKLQLTETEIQNIHNWSDSDKAILFSGKIDFDGYSSEEALKQEVELLQQKADSEDLSVVVSLREKMASDKKLTKTQVKEAAGETSTLASEYEVELSDFDNQSQLKQVDTLNQIVNDKIEINNRYIQQAQDIASEELEIANQRKENLEKELESLQYRNDIYKDLTDEEKNRLEDLKNIIPAIGDEIDNLSYIAENGLNLDEINNLTYDNLIAGIDSVITEAEVLRNLTDEIGESWTIAADKIENFGKNFPEILESAENYQFLQDGSLQLTEAGREALEETLNARKANLEAVNEEYQLELQKQADIQQATADYYTQQADLLEAYLNGQSSAKDTEAAMEEGLNKYKAELAKITGENDKELNETIQTNLGYTVDIAKMDTKQIFDYWCEVGKAAEAASLAYENKSFVPPAGNFGGGGAGTKTTSYQGSTRDISSGDYLKDFDDDQIQSMIDDYRKMAEEATNKAADYISKKVGAESSLKSFINSADKAISGEGNGKSSKKSGGSKKDKKDKDDKKLEDEFDRYWEIKKAIDATDRSLKKLDKDQENLYGKELINSLHQENELLEQQAANYTALAEAQKQEAAELQSVLSGYGVAFDASGAITNYAAATAAALQQYNDAIHQYNMGLIDESTLGVYEKNYEKFKKALERYDQLFYTEMKDTEEKLDEIRRKELANNLKAWEVEIQLKLDMKDLERQWNDFIHKVTKDFKKVYSDLRVDLKNMLKDAGTYVGDEGTINTIIGGVHDVANEIDKMRFGGTSDMFESISQAQEKLKELNSQLLESGEALHDLVEQAYDNLLDGIDQVADQFDDLIDRFEKINDELEFQKQIIELLYGEEAYGLMSKYYEGQLKNTGVQIESLKQQVDFWQKEFEISGATMENQKNWTKEQQKIYEELIEAQGDLNDKVLEYIQLLKDEYLNTVKDVLKQFDNFVSGSSLENVKTQWERISDRADKYYDSVEKAYEVQNLANKMDKDIAATTNLKTQQKLKALRDSEIEFLREKEKLTQHDIEYSEAKFQIALKEAALEDAQNNKTSMKLTRNEQGNWSYQYIADEEDTASKRQELLDAYNQLYQLASDAYEKNLESMQELQEKYLQSLNELAEKQGLSDQERAEQELAIRQWYEEEYSALAEENTQYRNELVEAGSALLLEVYEEDQSAYEYMSETERELLDALVQAHIDGFLDLEEKLQENYQNIGDKAKDVMTETREDWTSGAQHIADIWNGDGGDSVRNQITHVYNVIEQATQHYKDMVDWCAEAVGRDFSEEGIAGAIMKAENETDNLRNKTAQLVNDSHGYLADLRRYIEEIEAAWQSVQQAIMDAIGLIQEYLKYMGAASAAGASGGVAGGGAIEGESPTRSSSGGEGSSGTKSTSNDSGSVRYNMYGSGVGYGTWTDIDTKKKISAPAGGVHMATGGYTGDWNSDEGKIAILHQKELVLNQDDTKNFLSGIKMIRDLSSGTSIGEAVMRAVANTALSFGTMKAGTGANISNDNRRETSNVFNIAAEFPNANDVNEIREAILSLPNLASQYINNNLR